MAYGRTCGGSTFRTTDTRPRLTILGGLLGTGKTTWLRNGLQAQVLVNKVAGVAVDDALLTGLAVRLAASLDLVDRHRGGAVMAEAILETSGAADPAAITEGIAGEPVLVHHFRIMATLVLIDVEKAFASGRISPLAVHQMPAADRLALTKTDTVPSALETRLVVTVQHLNPLA